MRQMIYLDNAATTRVTEEILSEMLPYFTTAYQNPAAAYRSAKIIRDAVETSRRRCAELIHAHAEEIYFTSGGTESDNWALTGAIELTGKNHVVTTAIEHHAIIRACEHLQRKGIRVTFLSRRRERTCFARSRSREHNRRYRAGIRNDCQQRGRHS